MAIFAENIPRVYETMYFLSLVKIKGLFNDTFKVYLNS